MAYQANSINMDAVAFGFGSVIGDPNAPTAKKEYTKDPNFINTYITDEAFDKNNNEIWLDVKWIPNTNPGMEADTIVAKFGHEFYFDNIADGASGLQSLGYKPCLRHFKDSAKPNGRSCPWCNVSYELGNFSKTYPTHPKAQIFKEANEKAYGSMSNGYYTNIFVVNSNIPEIVGKTLVMKPHIREWYKNYFLAKYQPVPVRGVVKPSVNIFAPNYPLTRINIFRGASNGSPWNKEWKFADVTPDDVEYYNKTNEQIYAELGLNVAELIQPHDLKKYSYKYNEIVTQEELVDLDAYANKQFDLAKQWIALNFPECIPTTQTFWIKKINPNNFMQSNAAMSTLETPYMDPTGGANMYGAMPGAQPMPGTYGQPAAQAYGQPAAMPGVNQPYGQQPVAQPAQPAYEQPSMVAPTQSGMMANDDPLAAALAGNIDINELLKGTEIPH